MEGGLDPTSFPLYRPHKSISPLAPPPLIDNVQSVQENNPHAIPLKQKLENLE
jgi:hypothetical protein